MTVLAVGKAVPPKPELSAKDTKVEKTGNGGEQLGRF
jgi:hypothetical protein